VKGIDNLRVVGASIMPHAVSANTNATVLAIAELEPDINKRNIVTTGEENHVN
jgi:choline dehydrogenase